MGEIKNKLKRERERELFGELGDESREEIGKHKDTNRTTYVYHPIIARRSILYRGIAQIGGVLLPVVVDAHNVVCCIIHYAVV